MAKIEWILRFKVMCRNKHFNAQLLTQTLNGFKGTYLCVHLKQKPRAKVPATTDTELNFWPGFLRIYFHYGAVAGTNASKLSSH